MKKLLFLLLFLPIILSAQNTMFDVCPLKVGEAIPESAVVYNQTGTAINLGEITKDKATVIIFYRGAWCGYCTQHLAAIQEAKPAIEALGFEILAISPDADVNKSIEKTEGDYQFFSDPSTATIQAFGLDWHVDDPTFEKYKNEYKIDLEAWSGDDHHNLPVPAVYIIKDNLVQFNYVNPNYRLRLNSETLVALLKTL